MMVDLMASRTRPVTRPKIIGMSRPARSDISYKWHRRWPGGFAADDDDSGVACRREEPAPKVIVR
jgi:hypothetical protein